jgi:hypothetical protein
MNKVVVSIFSRLCLILVLTLSIQLVSAVQQDAIRIDQYQPINVNQLCVNSTYANITSAFIDGKNVQIINSTTEMIKSGDMYSYVYENTNVSGNYYFYGVCDENGVVTPWGLSYLVKSNSIVFLIVLLSLAVIFFISTLIVSEEFLVYISGVFFLLSGMYIMINGIDIVNDMYSRGIAIGLLGIGMLFTIGAYIFNTNYKNNSDAEEEYD